MLSRLLNEEPAAVHTAYISGVYDLPYSRERVDLSVVSFLLCLRDSGFIPVEEGLKSEFPHLKEVIVEPVISDPNDKGRFVTRLGMRTARFILEQEPDRQTFGLSCGSSLHAVVEAFGQLKAQGKQLPRNCRIYPTLRPILSR